MIGRRVVACVAVVLAAVMAASGCQRPDARGVVSGRRKLYSGSTVQYWLVVRQPDGSTGEIHVTSRTWRGCRLHEPYPACAQRAR